MEKNSSELLNRAELQRVVAPRANTKSLNIKSPAFLPKNVIEGVRADTVTLNISLAT